MPDVAKRIEHILWGETSFFFFCWTTFCLLFLGGYHLQKCALEMGYCSQRVLVSYANLKNRVLLTLCLKNYFTVAIYLHLLPSLYAVAHRILPQGHPSFWYFILAFALAEAKLDVSFVKCSSFYTNSSHLFSYSQTETSMHDCQ